MYKISPEVVAYCVRVRANGWCTPFKTSRVRDLAKFCNERGVTVRGTGEKSAPAKRDYARALVEAHLAPDGFGEVNLPWSQSAAGSGAVVPFSQYRSQKAQEEARSSPPVADHASFVAALQQREKFAKFSPIPSERRWYDNATTMQLNEVAGEYGLRAPRGSNPERRDTWWNLLAVLGFIPGIDVKRGTRLNPIRIKARYSR